MFGHGPPTVEVAVDGLLERRHSAEGALGYVATAIARADVMGTDGVADRRLLLLATRITYAVPMRITSAVNTERGTALGTTPPATLPGLQRSGSRRWVKCCHHSPYPIPNARVDVAVVIEACLQVVIEACLQGGLKGIAISRALWPNRRCLPWNPGMEESIDNMNSSLWRG